MGDQSIVRLITSQGNTEKHGQTSMLWVEFRLMISICKAVHASYHMVMGLLTEWIVVSVKVGNRLVEDLYG
jgi:hypothetical protein